MFIITGVALVGLVIFTMRSKVFRSRQRRLVNRPRTSRVEF
ncbi:Uncharacterised protein [Mycobacteroides abscessus subsp. abscessus]|nr:Uncharacterised protein [Mycobacteroides abscessus subsp. abscessus]